jgi:hypothetical protein
MLGVFSLRLACGLVAALVLLSPSQINPRFFRVQFLTALCLTAVAALFLRDRADEWTWSALGAAMALTFLGTLTWSLEKAPGGRTLIFLAALALAGALASLALTGSGGTVMWNLAGEFTSAAVLGLATAAMLMGHSYLLAPAMSLTPLLRLLAGLFAALAARGLVSGLGFWTSDVSLAKLSDTTVVLPLRWGLGIVLPFILAGMAWESARIRATQSATGILYVVVIFCFVGELMSLLLNQWSHLL